MIISHTITFNNEPDVVSLLNAAGIQYQIPHPHRLFVRVSIHESDPNWPVAQKLMQDKGVESRIFETYFSDEEILRARWLRMFGFPEKGYPQSEKKWLKDKPNYSQYCESCGTFEQKSSFYLKKEPQMGKYDFMSLNWTSSVFAVPRVFTALQSYNVQGYEKWPALLQKTKEPAKSVHQLYIPALDKPALVNSNELEPKVCSICHRVKYQKYHQRGIMYLLADIIPKGIDIFETYEWFGSGFQPYREIIVSNRVAKLAYTEGWKGVSFKVAELV